MRKVKVTRSYQVTIPAEVREELGIRVGDRLVVKVEDGKIVLEKEKAVLPTFRVGRKVALKDIEEAVVGALQRTLVLGMSEAVMDTNVYVYGAIEDSEFHERAAGLLGSLSVWHTLVIVVHEVGVGPEGAGGR